MTDHELQPLKDLALPIVIPKKLPPELLLDEVVAKSDPVDGDGYEITWKSDDAELQLRATSCDLGRHRKGEETIEFETRYFGELHLERSGKEIVSQWFSELQSGLPAYNVTARGLEPDDVIEFVHSLDYVRIN